MKNYALIVAGGVGRRMESETPKQFLNIGGQPVLMHTITTFYQYDHNMEIILVLPHSHFSQWTELSLIHDFDVPHRMVGGGSTRFHSVKNGLDSINGDGVVAIHDGVRPLVELSIIKNGFEVANKEGNAVVSIELKDSLRHLKGQLSKSIDRIAYRAIQTPQTFKISEIKKAYNIEYQESITDDASVAELAGQRINLIEGSYRNIKITTMEDLVIAEALLKSK